MGARGGGWFGPPYRGLSWRASRVVIFATLATCGFLLTEAHALFVGARCGWGIDGREMAIGVPIGVAISATAGFASSFETACVALVLWTGFEAVFFFPAPVWTGTLAGVHLLQAALLRDAFARRDRWSHEDIDMVVARAASLLFATGALAALVETTFSWDRRAFALSVVTCAFVAWAFASWRLHVRRRWLARAYDHHASPWRIVAAVMSSATHAALPLVHTSRAPDAMIVRETRPGTYRDADDMEIAALTSREPPKGALDYGVFGPLLAIGVLMMLLVMLAQVVALAH